MDLACTLAYWVQADDPADMQSVTSMITNQPGCLTRAQAVELYGQRTGRTMDQIDFYYCFGLFRLAVIVQQIYYRYYHGQTKDPRFAQLGQTTQALLAQAARVIAQSAL
jgi:aminoglycoside phosphotransferase (APT) family kinase protein